MKLKRNSITKENLPKNNNIVRKCSKFEIIN